MRTEILDALVTDLLKIKTPTYENTVKKVYKKALDLDFMRKLNVNPCMSISPIGERVNRTSDGLRNHISSYVVVCYIKSSQDLDNEGKLTVLADSLYEDVVALFDTHLEVRKIDGVEDAEITGMASFLDGNNLDGFFLINLEITYWE